MKKRSLIWLVAVALALSAAAYLSIVYLKSDNGQEMQRAVKNQMFSIKAVPSDASVILIAEHLDELLPLASDTASVITSIVSGGEGTFSGYVFRIAGSRWADNDAVLTLHPSMSGRMSQLLSISDTGAEDGPLASFIRSIIPDAVPSDYNGINIYESASTEVCFAFCDALTLLCDSRILLESSLRHIQEGLSILDKDEFKQVYDPQEFGPLTLMLRNSDIEKIFSAYINRQYRSYAPNLASLASWTILDIEQKKGDLEIDAALKTVDVNRKYTEVLKTQTDAPSTVRQALPFYTGFYYSVSAADADAFLEKFGNYLYANHFRTGTEAVPDGPLEVAYASFMTGTLQSVDLVQTDEPLSPRQVVGVCSRFGSIFSKVEPEDTCRVGRWLIAGSRSAIDEYRTGKATFLSLDDYLRSSRSSVAEAEDCINSVYVNFSQFGDHPLQAFVAPFQQRFERASLHSEMLNAMYARVKGGETPSVSVSYDVMKMPAVLMDIERDTTVTIPQGPFPVEDVDSGNTFWFEQTPNLYLRLSNETRKGLWSAPFTAPICGFVRQVDYYGNGKLQMLFASGRNLYLMDRTGRYVAGYPHTLPKDVLLGPEVYDLKGRGGYMVMIIHTDNTLNLYTIDGKPAEGWTEVTSREKIKTMPALEWFGDDRYWVLRTSVQTRIFNLDGTPVANFEGDRRLRPDTEITYLSGSTVSVACYDGLTCKLNLSTGEFTVPKKSR